jgi:structural maintenance of chromosome 3 (chondroitin sulfate proteoglycan 6)
LEAKRKQMLETRHMVAAQAAATSRDEEASRQRVVRLERDLNEAEADLRDAKTKRESYEAEIKTPMTQTLSNAEVQQLTQLSAEVEQQKNALSEATEERQNVSQI